MLKWEIMPVRLELKYTWKISRNTSTHKVNFIIGCNYRNWKGIGETAPNVRYGETSEVINAEFSRFLSAGGANVSDLHELTQLLNSLKLKNALRFGIESAYIHMLCHAEKTSITDFLGIKAVKNVSTSYTMPILDISEVKPFYEANRLDRFKIVKLKTNAETGTELLRHFSAFSNQPVIIDPNEAYTNADDLLRFMHEIKDYNVALIEQPMPATCTDDYKAAKKMALFPLMADESICDGADFELLTQQFDYVNMKLMKAGGYLNGLHILQTARKHQMKTMIGCMVETSIGISSAFHLCDGIDYADLDGFMIVKDEPYKLLHEENGDISLSHAQAVS